MNSFYKVTYFLTQACLGEIDSNFNRIYWVIDGVTIKVYFYINDENECEIEEIMSTFDSYIEEDNELTQFSTQYEIIHGKENYLETSNLKFFAEIFRARLINLSESVHN